MQPWTSCTHMHLCAAARSSHRINMCTARSVLYALRAPAPVDRLDFHVRYSTCTLHVLYCSLKSSRVVTQVHAGHCTALDLRTLGCEMVQGANLPVTRSGFIQQHCMQCPMYRGHARVSVTLCYSRKVRTSQGLRSHPEKLPS